MDLVWGGGGAVALAQDEDAHDREDDVRVEDEVVDRGPGRYPGFDGEPAPFPPPDWAEPGVVALPAEGPADVVLHVALVLGDATPEHPVIRWTQVGAAGESVALALPAEAARDPRRARWASTVWVRVEAVRGGDDAPPGRLEGWVVWDRGIEAPPRWLDRAARLREAPYGAWSAEARAQVAPFGPEVGLVDVGDPR